MWKHRKQQQQQAACQDVLPSPFKIKCIASLPGQKTTPLGIFGTSEFHSYSALSSVAEGERCQLWFLWCRKSPLFDFVQVISHRNPQGKNTQPSRTAVSYIWWTELCGEQKVQDSLVQKIFFFPGAGWDKNFACILVQAETSCINQGKRKGEARCRGYSVSPVRKVDHNFSASHTKGNRQSFVSGMISSK